MNWFLIFQFYTQVSLTFWNVTSTVVPTTTTATPETEEHPEQHAMESALTTVALELDVERKSRREVEEDATGDLIKSRLVRTRDLLMRSHPLVRPLPPSQRLL
jgi:hypothetical protein